MKTKETFHDKISKLLKKKKRYYEWPPRCCGCNEFMSYRQLSRSITYTPYGGGLDLDPPEQEYYHRKCWRKLSKQDKILIKKISWMLPYDRVTHKIIEI